MLGKMLVSIEMRGFCTDDSRRSLDAAEPAGVFRRAYGSLEGAEAVDAALGCTGEDQKPAAVRSVFF